MPARRSHGGEAVEAFHLVIHRFPALGSLDQTFCWGGEAEVSVSNYYLSEIRP
ncbi:MAG: hypothetical protein WB696_10165 [Chthoniobacterales bacterium]